MADPNNAQQKEVKVEDLLRLKRAEKPDDAFWNNFDRELHQRMLQTLVKKDPWYVQLLRGISGRIAQTTAVGAAAAFLAMMVVRPAFVDSIEPAAPLPTRALATLSTTADAPTQAEAAPVEVAMSDLDSSLVPDYQIEAIAASSAGNELGYTSDYSHDRFEVVTYDSDAYATDSASFAVSGVATGLIY